MFFIHPVLAIAMSRKSLQRSPEWCFSSSRKTACCGSTGYLPVLESGQPNSRWNVRDVPVSSNPDR